jgi:cystathionine beta-lyase
VPTALLTPEIAARTVTLMAPSKTYNVPGLGTSIAIIPDRCCRARFVRATAGIVAEVTCLGFTACEAAYRDGEPWRQALLAPAGQPRFPAGFHRARPARRAVEAPVEATYLLWLNVSALGLVAHFEQHGVGPRRAPHFNFEQHAA